jgi:hypothetical protein
LFNNPVGYLPSKAWLQVLQETLRVSMLRILLFLSGCCLKTEVFKQLYSKKFATKARGRPPRGQVNALESEEENSFRRGYYQHIWHLRSTGPAYFTVTRS